jgi:hypothetical protein
MRNYTINDEKTATIRNLYNGDEFTARFPMDEDELISIADRASCYGSHDYIVVCVEGFYNLIGSDYVSLLDVNDVAERVERLEDDDAEKLEAMAEVVDDLDEIERVWDDSYFVADTTGEDYAQELCYECGYMPCKDLPEWISYHIDWEGVFRELSVDGYSEINGGVLYVAR